MCSQWMCSQLIFFSSFFFFSAKRLAPLRFASLRFAHLLLVVVVVVVVLVVVTALHLPLLCYEYPQPVDNHLHVIIIQNVIETPHNQHPMVPHQILNNVHRANLHVALPPRNTGAEVRNAEHGVGGGGCGRGCVPKSDTPRPRPIVAPPPPPPPPPPPLLQAAPSAHLRLGVVLPAVPRSKGGHWPLAVICWGTVAVAVSVAVVPPQLALAAWRLGTGLAPGVGLEGVGGGGH